jgi:hypothetical protein
MMKRYFPILAAFILLKGAAAGPLASAGTATDHVDPTASDPLHATYWIEDEPVALVDGRNERPAAPGSAIMILTAVWKRPVFGDLDGDGDDDAALLLIYNPGGSGMFFYVTAAIHSNGRYQGINTFLLGDRITPKDLAIRDRMIVATYADRRPNEPFSTRPSVDRTISLMFQNGQLSATASTDELDQIIHGLVIIGHEVRSFRPCGKQTELWLMGPAPALQAILSAYHQVVPDPKRYRPVFMVLAGRQVDPPLHGFGADYDGAFLTTHLVRVRPEASCRTISPSAGLAESVRKKIAFDISALDEEGLWGPPGGKRALSYEFCIPNSAEKRGEVQGIDSSIRFFSASPGRIGCADHEILCVGSTHQQNFAEVLWRLAGLPYVPRIQQTFFE